MNEARKKFKLNNGLTLLTVPMKGVQSVTVLCMVRTGSRDEPEELAGISHFLEHMVFKGTKDYPDAQAITSAIDSIGGEFNAFTSKEYTGFYVKLAAKHLERGVDVLSQMLTKPRLDKDAIEREKGVVIEEINMYEDLPPRKAVYLYECLIFGDNSLGRPTIGSRETVASLSRKALDDYLSSRYTSGRTVVGVVGGVGNGGWSEKKIRDLVEEKFSGLSKGNYGWGKPISIKQNEPKVEVFNKETGQAHFVIGVPGFKRGHSQRYALAVLAVVLGGNMSSRLFTEVRDKRGLAYYVKSDVDVFFDTGSLLVQAGVDIGKFKEALKVVLEQFVQVKDKQSKGRLTEKEVSRSKEYLKGRFILEMEDSHEVADHYVRRFLLEQEIMEPDEFIDKIESVTWEDVQNAALEIFQSKLLNLAVVGPFSSKDRQSFRKLLNL